MNNLELLKTLSIKIIKDSDDIYYSVILLPSTNDQLIITLTDIFKTNGTELYDFVTSFSNAEDKKEFLETGLVNIIENELENEIIDIFTPINNYFIPQDIATKYNIDNNDIIVPNVFNNYSIDDYWTLVNNENTLLYFVSKNIIKDYVFTEDELNSLNTTFMQLIINLTTFTDYSYGNNAVYKAVIDYYANGQYDPATILMNTVFNTEIKTTVSTSSCGCGTQNTCYSTSNNDTTSTINTGVSIINYEDATCLDKYKAAMYQWLIQMLSDTDFYCCWIMVSDDENNVYEPNEVLLDSLITLLKEFLSLGYDLSNLTNKDKSTCGCGHQKQYGNLLTGDCPDITNSGMAGCSNYTIINNYIKVLEWVKNNQIEENKNKIYVYGKQFAEIFPLLSF